jgi:GT2 family glycosyltransferase
MLSNTSVSNLATIAVVPRERLSGIAETFEALALHTPPDVRFLWIDNETPLSLRDATLESAAKLNVQRIGTERLTTPNRARNIALARIETRYVVFLDNDAIVSAGWLERLVDCAEETGAAAVGATTLIGAAAEEIIHWAGGIGHFEIKNGVRRFIERHEHTGSRLRDVRDGLCRKKIESLEFHAALFRTEALREIGGCDERLPSALEHLDVSLRLKESGGIFFEPDSVVTYLPPPPFHPADIAYYRWRWSDLFNEQSLSVFAGRWGVAKDDPFLKFQRWWLRRHRQFIFGRLQPAVHLLDRAGLRFVADALEPIVARARIASRA